jgi:hypothetical protein
MLQWGIALFALLPVVAVGQSEALRNPILIPGAAWALTASALTCPLGTGGTSWRGTQAADLGSLPDGTKLAAAVAWRALSSTSVAGNRYRSDTRRAVRRTRAASMKLVDYAAQPFAPKGALCPFWSVRRPPRQFSSARVLLVRGELRAA